MDYAPPQTAQPLRRSPRKRNHEDVADEEDSEQSQTQKSPKRRRMHTALPKVEPTRLCSTPRSGELDPMEELAKTITAPIVQLKTTKKAVPPSVDADDAQDEKRVPVLLDLPDREDDNNNDKETVNEPDERILDGLDLPPLQLSGDATHDGKMAEKTANAKSQPVLYGVKSILKMTNIFWADPEWAIDWDWLIYDRLMDNPECRLMNQVHLLANNRVTG